MTGPLTDVWRPVASSSDLVARHIYETRLDGRELAVWRADSGGVNVWENRCPHRGVRLSIGASLGEELRCQYHGVRFASGTGACTAIPARPGIAPGAALRVRSWIAVEAVGLVWTNLSAAAPVMPIPDPPEPWLVLRALPINRPRAEVEDALRVMSFGDRLEARVSVQAGIGRDGLMADKAHYFIQPLDAHHCIVRGIMGLGAIPGGSGLSRLDVLRIADLALERLRRGMESADGAAGSGASTC